MLPFTKIIAGASTNVVEPSDSEINQGNSVGTSYPSNVNNGYYRLMCQAIHALNAELINVVNTGGVTPNSDLTNVMTALDLLFPRKSSLGTASGKNTGTSSDDVPLLGVHSASDVLAGLTYIGSKPNFNYNSGNTITVTSGVFTFSDNSGRVKNSFSGTKTMSSWAAGSGNGGLDTGSVAANTWYYVFSIYNLTTLASDYLISASPTSPAMPAGYTKSERLSGFFKTNGSSSIIPFFLSSDGTWSCTTTVAAEQQIISATSQPGSNATLSGVFPTVKNLATVALEMTLTQNGYSSYTNWGNLQSTPTTALSSTAGLRAASIGTNNGFCVNGLGQILNDNGSIWYRNFETGGGVSSIRTSYLTIKDLS